MSYSVRALDNTDLEASRRLGWEAFGQPHGPLPDEPDPLPSGMRPFGLFDDDDLVARMIDREYDSHFGGSTVPTCGIAGVTTVAEHRGRGALTPLFRATLTAAVDRGAAISTLFPSAPRIYRRFGYELVGDYVTVEVPTAALAPPDGETIPVRRATWEDYAEVRRVYTEWANEQNGPLTRRGISFSATAEDFIGSFTGVTVAVDEQQQVCGYASWNRGRGFGPEGRVEVADLIATRPEATRALLTVLSGFASVASTTRIDTSGADLARLLLPGLTWQVVDSWPYMLRLLNLPLAFASRRFAPSLETACQFTLVDEFLDELSGGWSVEVSGGEAHCVRMPSTDPQAPVLTGRGLALMYAGAQSAANLRMAGLLTGDHAADGDWDAIFGGRQFHIRDYF